MLRVSDMNLLLQIGISVILFVGIIYVKRIKFNVHGYWMFLAVTLNVPSVFSVMIPSVFRILSGATINLFTSFVLIHSLLGVIVFILGWYVLWVWRFRVPGGSCFRLKTFMKFLTPLWIATVISGGIMYLQLY